MPEADFFESIRERLRQNPANLGWIAIAAGALFLAAAIFNWEWFFRGHSYNTEKIEGISNMYGRGCAQLFAGIGGVVLIVIGIVVLVMV